MTGVFLSIEADRLEIAVNHLIRLVNCEGTSGSEGPVVDETETICIEIGLPVERMAVSPGRDNLPGDFLTSS